MKQIWFKKAGWLYLRIHAMGILITLAAIAFMLLVCISVFRNGHSGSDDLYEIFMMLPVLLFGGNGLQKKLLNSI